MNSQALALAGITSVHDPKVDEKTFGAYMRLRQKGELPLRFHMMDAHEMRCLFRVATFGLRSQPSSAALVWWTFCPTSSHCSGSRRYASSLDSGGSDATSQR